VASSNGGGRAGAGHHGCTWLVWRGPTRWHCLAASLRPHDPPPVTTARTMPQRLSMAGAYKLAVALRAGAEQEARAEWASPLGKIARPTAHVSPTFEPPTPPMELDADSSDPDELINMVRELSNQTLPLWGPTVKTARELRGGPVDALRPCSPASNTVAVAGPATPLTDANTKAAKPEPIPTTGLECARGPEEPAVGFSQQAHALSSLSEPERQPPAGDENQEQENVGPQQRWRPGVEPQLPPRSKRELLASVSTLPGQISELDPGVQALPPDTVQEERIESQRHRFSEVSSTLADKFRSFMEHEHEYFTDLCRAIDERVMEQSHLFGGMANGLRDAVENNKQHHSTVSARMDRHFTQVCNELDAKYAARVAAQDERVEDTSEYFMDICANMDRVFREPDQKLAHELPARPTPTTVKTQAPRPISTLVVPAPAERAQCDAPSYEQRSRPDSSQLRGKQELGVLLKLEEEPCEPKKHASREAELAGPGLLKEAQLTMINIWRCWREWLGCNAPIVRRRWCSVEIVIAALLMRWWRWSYRFMNDGMPRPTLHNTISG
jgi:hypothetical protein